MLVDKIDILLENNKKYLWIVPCLLAFICFINTVSFGFVYDDIYHVVKAEKMLGDWSLDNLKQVFTSDFWTSLTNHLRSEEKKDSFYYRPISVVELMVIYTYAKVSAWKWHLTCVMLHVIATGLAYKVIRTTLEKIELLDYKKWVNLLSLVASMVFAIHPVQSESVAWISAYVNALLAIKIFLALLVYLKAREFALKDKRFIFLIIVSAFFYGLALFTKEPAIALAILLLSYEVFLLRHKLAWINHLFNCFIRALPFVLVTFIYIFAKFSSLGRIRPEINQNFVDASNPYSIIIFSLPNIIINYLKILVCPVDLKPFSPVTYIYEPTLSNFYLPIILLLLLASFFLIKACNNVLIRVALIWVIVPLLPALNIYAFPPENLVQDRYLYFSLIGAGLLLGQCMLIFNEKLVVKNDKQEITTKIHILPLLSTLTIFIILMIITINQNYIWVDEWQFWSFVKERIPQSCTANLELGRLNINSNLYEQAISYYEEAKKVCPKNAGIHKQLGRLYGRKEDFIRAEAEFRQMIELATLSSTAAVGYYNLGLVYSYKVDKEQAIMYLQKAIELDPNSETALTAKNKIDSITVELNKK